MAKEDITSESGLTDADKSALLEIKEDNTAIIEEGIHNAIIRALEKIGLTAEGYAKKACPVDTGRLRNSITHQLDGDKAVYIGTNVEYGPYVELGTSTRDPKPFLRPAAEDHYNTYRQILKSEMNS